MKVPICPECGGQAIAVEYKSEGDPPVPVLIDHQWCSTEGCKHNHWNGEPWGTGMPSRVDHEAK
jgi:uncharacterized protein with PIN domain